VQSWRDLPLLINQWANVVRWEMRTRLFLRTAEFLWQEGHTAHATEAEAREETMRMLEVYRVFAEEWMAMPVVTGRKTDGERFPGAVDTFSIEAMMQDRKALQAGTSHFLGQNFAKASEIKFLDQAGTLQHAWTTSWGVSTRLVGGLIMTHGDDDGLMVPPRLAPTHVVILPITPKPESAAAIHEACEKLAKRLRELPYAGRTVEVEVDRRDLRGGDKMWQWVKKGAPVRVEIGPRDLEQGLVSVSRRDRGVKEREAMSSDVLVGRIVEMLEEIQRGMFDRAKAHVDLHSRRIDDPKEFRAFFTPSKPETENAPTEIHGGFAWSRFCMDPAEEIRLKNELGVTVRCIPLQGGEDPGPCILTGKPATRRVVFAKAY
jgi:prolyl-tRNA synthetase